MATTIQANQKVKFNYKSIEGKVSIVDALYVDKVFTSTDGFEIVVGFIDDAGQEGRSYRADNITDVEVL